MAYFNHAFRKSAIVSSLTSAGQAGDVLGVDITLNPGQLGAFNAKTWEALDITNATPDDCCNFVLAVGSPYPNDKIGPFHGGYQESIKTKAVNPKYISKIYRGLSNAAQNYILHVGNTSYSSANPPATGECCKTFLCGETYYLRIDAKGSPALRLLNHQAYLTVSAYGGCCADETIAPVAVDSTLMMIQWAEQIVESPILSPFVFPVVTSEDGDLYYPPGSTGLPVGADTWDNYTSAGHTEGECAGLTLIGAYEDTKFGDCTFQTSDFYEKEPVRLYASETDLNGNPCEFEGICTVVECAGRQANGLGETVARDFILSESYRQNHFATDLRIREITQGDALVGCAGLVDRNALYDRLFLLHNVPRFNNPTGTFDNDQYLVDLIFAAGSANLATVKAFLEGYAAGCGNDCTDPGAESGAACASPSVPLPTGA